MAIPGSTTSLTSTNLSFFTVKMEITPSKGVTKTRIDVYGRPSKGLIKLQMINNSKYYLFPSLGMSHTKFCYIHMTLYTVDIQSVVHRPA